MFQAKVETFKILRQRYIGRNQGYIEDAKGILRRSVGIFMCAEVPSASASWGGNCPAYQSACGRRAPPRAGCCGGIFPRSGIQNQVRCSPDLVT